MGLFSLPWQCTHTLCFAHAHVWIAAVPHPLYTSDIASCHLSHYLLREGDLMVTLWFKQNWWAHFQVSNTHFTDCFKLWHSCWVHCIKFWKSIFWGTTENNFTLLRANVIIYAVFYVQILMPLLIHFCFYICFIDHQYVPEDDQNRSRHVRLMTNCKKNISALVCFIVWIESKCFYG